MDRQFEKAIFLDRDGVLNHDPGDYTTTVADFEILPNVLETLKTWWDLGYGFIVITNQAGIDKGLYSFETVDAIHTYFQGSCVMKGFAIDAFYFCPHHPEYSGKCLCRKPGSLMIEKALHRFNLNPKNCLMIGDKERDIEAARRAGVKGCLIDTNAGLHAGIIDMKYE
jgi:D-glycero-D-manno-heptose 1,7-bisphosphate phosphatase